MPGIPEVACHLGVGGRYRRIAHEPPLIERLFVDLFLDAHAEPPKEIVLDLDATDDPLHGHQEGRFFHGYYDCHCYLPLYVFCGRHLLVAELRRSNIDASAWAAEEVARILAQIRGRWPRTRIILRADSGFARESLMTWCEEHRVDYVFGLARNQRLVEYIAIQLSWAEHDAEETGEPARRFADFRWTTKDSWSRRRRVVAPPRSTDRVSFRDRIEGLLAFDGRMDARPRRERGRPALRRDLARGQRIRGSGTLRAALLRPRLASAVC